MAQIAEREIEVQTRTALTKECQLGAETNGEPLTQLERFEKHSFYLFYSRADRLDYTYNG